MPDQTSASTAPRKKRRAGDVLYDAALSLLAERPYNDITVEDICAAAGVGRATFFRYYGSKAGLLVEFNERLTTHAREAIARAGTTSAADQLRLVQTTLAEQWSATGPAVRELARAFLAEGSVAALGAHDDASVHPQLLTLVSEIVTAGQQSGELDSRLDPRFVAWIVVTALAGATSSWLARNGAGALAESTTDTLGVLLDGVLNRPS